MAAARVSRSCGPNKLTEDEGCGSYLGVAAQEAKALGFIQSGAGADPDVDLRDRSPLCRAHAGERAERSIAGKADPGEDFFRV